MSRRLSKSNLLDSCRDHSFCQGPQGEDPSNIDAIDLKSLLRQISPNKKPDLKTQVCWTEESTGLDFDVEYLKKISDHMDDSSTIKKGVPPVTEEGLRDWCQQSLNRFFHKVPESRPFMMPELVYKFLKDSAELELMKQSGRSLSMSAAPPKKLSESERNRILSRSRVYFNSLEARTKEGGIPFLSPKVREAHKKSIRRIPTKAPTRELPRYMHATRVSSRSVSRRNSVRRMTVSFSHTNPAPRAVIQEKSKLCIIDSRKAEIIYSILTNKGSLSGVRDAALKEAVALELTEPSILDDEPESSYEKLGMHIKEIVLKDRVNQVRKSLWFSRGLTFSNNLRWRLATDSYKEALSMDENFLPAKFNLACALERLGCYTFAKRYFLKTFAADKSLDSLLGVALTCYKLGEYGDSAYYAKRGLELNSRKWELIYLLLLSYIAIGQLQEAASCYREFLKFCKDTNSGFDMPDPELCQTSDVLSWLKTHRIPMFSRFNESQLQALLRLAEVVRIEPSSILDFKPGFTYAIVSGSAKIRDHSISPQEPSTLWNVQSGDYLSKDALEFLTHPEVIVQSTSPTILLKLNTHEFTDTLKKTRSSVFIVRQEVLSLSSLLHVFTPQTVELLIESLMVFRTVTRGQVILAQVSSLSSLSRNSRKNQVQKLECDFFVIVSGLCELKGSDGFVLANLGAGDYFGEEGVLPGVNGFASLGSIIAKDESVDLAILPHSLFYRVPQFELAKLQDLSNKRASYEKAEYHYKRKGARLLGSL